MPACIKKTENQHLSEEVARAGKQKKAGGSFIKEIRQSFMQR